MYTVGQLIKQLTALDPTTPVGIIDIDRHPGSQRATISLRNLVDIDVVHDAESGAPQAVWLTAQTSAAINPPTPPSTVVLTRTPCGCLIPMALAERRSVNLDAVPCPHHSPDELVIRSGRR